jgi:hypothetical protein
MWVVKIMGQVLLVLVAVDIPGLILHFQLHMSIEVYFGILDGILDRIRCLAPGIFDLALYLLSHAFDLECGIARQLASLALGASHHFIDCSIHAILIQRSTSVD